MLFGPRNDNSSHMAEMSKGCMKFDEPVRYLCSLMKEMNIVTLSRRQILTAETARDRHRISLPLGAPRHLCTYIEGTGSESKRDWRELPAELCRISR